MRLWRGLLAAAVALAFLTGGVLLADGYFREASQRRIADGLQQRLHLPESPTVSLGGWPFALSLITGGIPTASATAPLAPMTISGHQVTLRNLRVQGTELHLSGTELVIGRLDAEALLGYDDLSTLAGTDVGYASSGRIAAHYSANFLGQPLTASVSAQPRVDVAAQAVSLEDAEISVAGFPLTAELSQFLLDRVVKPIEVRLDLGLTLESVEATPDGLALHADATEFRSPLS